MAQPQFNNYPTPQQQQFYQLQQQQQGHAAPGTPPGMNSSWNSYAAPVGIDSTGYLGSTGNPMNGSMGEVPYSSNPQMMQQNMQQNLNPTAMPFVSGSGPLQRTMSEGSMGSGSGSGTPVTPGGSKRRNNPYANSAVADPSPGAESISPVTTSISPTQQQIVYQQQQAALAQQAQQIQQMQMQLQQGGGSPASGMQMQHSNQSGFSDGSPASASAGFPNFSPVAAPLPSTLPQRDGNIRQHRGHRGGHNQNYAGPHQGGGGRGHQGGNNHHHNNNQQQQQQDGDRAGANQGAPVLHEDVLAQAGTYVELARTANGSSFIQAAVREGSDPLNLQAIWAELSPSLSDLFLDAHGCYVIKSVMERLPPQQLHDAVQVMANDPQLVFSMCTHSLHTRRVVQFLLDSMDCPFIFNLLTTHCAEIAMTQQGCIVMQRAMDTSTGQTKLDLYNAIYSNLLRFCTDPFANYVVQHMLEVGDKAANSAVFRHSFLAHVIQLSCNKFASNVMEKALFHLDEQLQHELLVAIYDSGEDTLFRMLQDSFGNYLIQSSIALAQYKDVFFISEKLRPVLQRTPYGHKIEGRLDRRLKGKAVGTRSPMIGATFKANQNGQPGGQPQQGGGGQQQQGGGGRGRGGGFNRRQSPGQQQSDNSLGNSADSLDGDVVEEPW